MGLASEPDTLAIRDALEVLGDAGYDADIRTAALAELDDLVAARDQWKRVALHYQSLLDERGLL